jgi:integral membrane protein
MHSEIASSPAQKRFRLIANIEGWSYIILLFIAMPLKYLADLPMAVRIVGMLHGVLFVGFCISLTEMVIRFRWGLLKIILVFLSSLLPFGTFYMDRQLFRKSKK